jgi:hypothetical protein
MSRFLLLNIFVRKIVDVGDIDDAPKAIESNPHPTDIKVAPINTREIEYVIHIGYSIGEMFRLKGLV